MFLGQTQKFNFTQDFENYRIQSQDDSLHTIWKSLFSGQQCFVSVLKQKLIHKIVVSDFWKYIKPFDFWSQYLGKSIGFLQGKYTQIWHRWVLEWKRRYAEKFGQSWKHIGASRKMFDPVSGASRWKKKLKPKKLGQFRELPIFFLKFLDILIQ